MSYFVDGYIQDNYIREGISIDWKNKIIFIPKIYLTSTVNPYIFNLDTEAFRLALKELEESEDGMSFPDTNNHNTEVELGGVIYARTIEIINGYTVTFEDGQYAVNLFGSNNNIGDVIGLNKVSVRTNNAAGLIVDPGISESLDYGDSIVFDLNDGFEGARHPIGTRAKPVNNITDLIELLSFYNRDGVTLVSDFTATTSMIDVTFRAFTADENFDANGYSFSGCTFQNIILDGDFNHSKIKVVDCNVNNISNIGGIIEHSNLNGTIIMSEQIPLTIKQTVSTIPGSDSPIIDMVSGKTCSLNFRGYSGGIKILNSDTSGDIATIEMSQGQVNLDPSCTDGTLNIRGLAKLVDNSSGSTIVTTALLDPDVTNNLVFNGKVSLDSDSTYSGTLFPIGTEGMPVNNLEDAILIANERNINELHINGDWTFKDTDFISNFIIGGHGLQTSTFIMEDGAILLFCVVKEARVSGDITGIIEYDDCHLEDIYSTNITPTFRDVVAINCLLSGTISLTPYYFGALKLIDCKSANGGVPVFDMKQSQSNFMIRNYTGSLKLVNNGQAISTTLDFHSGEVEFDGTVSGGTYHVRGLAKLIDNSTSGATIISTALLDPSNIATSGGTGSCDSEEIAIAVWNELTSNGQVDGTFGKTLLNLITKADEAQHTLNVQTEMLKNKPNNC